MFNLPSEIFNDSLGFLTGIISVYIGLLGIGSIIGIALYVLNGLGIMKMSNSLNISNGWLGFIPFASIFALGRIGERYIKRDGTKSAKFSIWLLVFYILMSVLAILLTAFLVVFLLSLIVYAEEAISSDTQMTMEMFKGVVPVIICTLIILAVEIAYIILYYVCLWRVYSIFDSSNATLFLVLSIFFTFLAPIFMFIIRNKQPKVTYEERMNFNSFLIQENTSEENAPII